MTTTELRVALIGCGRMGLHHAKAIDLQPNARLVAIADPAVDRDKVETAVGQSVELFDDAVTMLETVKPDVVHIVTPPDTHVSYAKLCLEHGAHAYVEKPFALTVQEAREVIGLAEQKGLKVCAAHQVLFQDAGRKYQEFLHWIGRLVHVESYFSFKTVRRAGSGLMSPVEQLEDILPHPVYLLLSAFERADNSELYYELRCLDVRPDGEVRALINIGDAQALLIVTLRGRPIESYLRLVGTNGFINADFVLSGVTKIPGPGASAIAAVLQPFSVARQMVFGTLATLLKLIFKRQKSYAGLGELVQSFYASILNNQPVPVSYSSIVSTVDICQTLSEKLREAAEAAEAQARTRLADIEATLSPPDSDKGTVLVTGGTGFLGKAFVREIRDRGWPVRVIARRMPSAGQRIPGVEYVPGNIADAVDDSMFSSVQTVVHLAAETAGGKEEHERNTVTATRLLAEAAVRNGVEAFINISSIAVLKPSSVVGGPLHENSPVDLDNLGRGPYVWAKAEAERLVAEICARGNVRHKSIRLGPLVDFEQFTPPGRLGREVGRLFVAMGSPRDLLSVCDVKTAAGVIRHYVDSFDTAPDMLNLVEAPAPTRRDLVERMRRARPEIRVMWLPTPILKGISWTLKTVLKVAKPNSKPLDLYAAFASEQYDIRLAEKTIAEASRR